MNEADNCQCDCGKVHFRVHGQPLLRCFCHCTICQQFNQADFADITIFRARHVELPDASLVNYRAYQQPPLLRRGQCTGCGRPAVEIAKLIPFSDLIVVPSANIRDSRFVPEPCLHMFYHRRKADSDDGLPRYSGYLASQLGLGRALLPALLGRSW